MELTSNEKNGVFYHSAEIGGELELFSFAVDAVL